MLQLSLLGVRDLKGARRSSLTSSLALILSVVLFLSWVPSSVLADRGGMPLVPYVRILEPGQKAIIAWNGQEEILILSTDVKANQSTLILELLPLPSNPKAVEKANFSSFIKLQQILWNPIRSHWESESLSAYVQAAGSLAKTVVVTFHEKIGAHNITVVKAENASELALWINDFLKRNSVTNEISLQEYASIFEDYISRGFPYFALDLVDVSPKEKSVEPILYHFETSFLYYPLKISTLFSGNTKIKLFILTRRVCDFLYYYRMVNPPWATSLVYVDDNRTKAYAPANFIWSLDRVYHFNLTIDKLREIDLRFESLFNSSASLTILEYEGDLDIFTGDLIVSEGEALVVYPFIPSLPLRPFIPFIFELPEVTVLKVVPSSLITIKTLEGIIFTYPSPEVLTLVDYHSPVIDSIGYSVLLDGSVSVQCQVNDSMSGVNEVTLFYQFEDEEWKSERMRETNRGFAATILMEPYENLNFYVEAFDLAGNRAVEDNDLAYYSVDAMSYMLTLILRNVGLIAACILAAGFIALIVKIYMEKRNKLQGFISL